MDINIGGQTTVLTPVGSTTDATPSFSWKPIDGAVRYELWVDRLQPWVQKIVYRTNLTGTSFVSSALPLGTYRTWVRAVSAANELSPWSVPADFTISIVQLPAPVVTQGQNSTFDRTPTFAWNAVSGAAKYNVVVRNLKNLQTVVDQQNIVGTSWTPATPFADGPYAWWVSALTAANVRGVWTGQMDINIGGQPIVLTPAGTTTNHTPTFSWKPVDGAVRYQLWVNRENPFVQQIIYQKDLSGTAYIPDPLPAGTYRAWVLAVSATDEYSPWSVPVEFTITDTAAIANTLLVNLSGDRKLRGVLERLFDADHSVEAIRHRVAQSDVTVESAASRTDAQPLQEEPAPAKRPLVSEDQSFDAIIVQWMMNPMVDG
jgi:hypothetical protein